MVSLTLVFGSSVTLQTGAISLVKRGGSAVPFTLSNPSGDGRTWLFTFTGGNLENGSLPDGIYDLTVDGSKVLGSGGIPLSQNYSFAFHRLLADVNGDRLVNVADIAMTKAYLGLPLSAWYFDINGDGVKDSADEDLVKSRSNRYSVGTYTSGATFTGPSTTSATFGLDHAYCGSSGLEFYYSSSWQVMEERVSGADNAVVQFTWSPLYVNCMIERDRNTDGSTANGLEERLYVLQDANYNVSAILSSSGTVLQRFVYDPYGARTVLNATWVSVTDAYAFGQGFQGGFADAITGLILFQRRLYSPTLGRWLQQDPAGYVDGANLYQFVGSNPVNSVDPSGLQTGTATGTNGVSGVGAGKTPPTPFRWGTGSGAAGGTAGGGSAATVGTYGGATGVYGGTGTVLGGITVGAAAAVGAALGWGWYRSGLGNGNTTRLGNWLGNCYIGPDTAGAQANAAATALYIAKQKSRATMADIIAQAKAARDAQKEPPCTAANGNGQQPPKVPLVASGYEDPDRNPAQDKKLTPGEIRKLQASGIDPEELKDFNSGLDLFKSKSGDIYIKPKSGSGPGDPTGININDL